MSAGQRSRCDSAHYLSALGPVRTEFEITKVFLTQMISRAIVQLDEPQPEFDHGDAGHVHKHRDNYIHANSGETVK